MLTLKSQYREPTTRFMTDAQKEALDWAEKRTSKALLALDALKNFSVTKEEGKVIRHSSIYSAPMETRLELEALKVGQVNRMVSGRVGNVVPSWTFNFSRQTQSGAAYCTCSVGEEEYETSLETLYKRIEAGKKASLFVAPFHEEEKDYSVCPHVANRLKKAFPQMEKQWRKMRKSLVDAEKKGKVEEVEKKWLRRDFGLYFFISDVGTGEAGEVLFRKEPKNFTKKGYSWVQGNPEGRKARSPQQGRLSARYYPYKAKAQSMGVPFLFNSAAEFVSTMEEKLPDDRELETLRLQWHNVIEKGYTPENFNWVPKATLSPNRQKPVIVGESMANFAGFVMELEQFQLISMRLMEILLEDPVNGSLSVEGAIEQVLQEFCLQH